MDGVGVKTVDQDGGVVILVNLQIDTCVPTISSTRFLIVIPTMAPVHAPFSSASCTRNAAPDCVVATHWTIAFDTRATRPVL